MAKQPTKSKLKSTTKSFTGLRESLFEEFDNLRNGKIDNSRANSLARMASEITRSALAEINAIRTLNRLADEDRKRQLKTITDGKIPK